VIRQTATGVEFDVRVIPRAGRSGIAGEREGRVLVRLGAPPVEGAANEALVTLIADLFDCPKRAVRLVAGERSRSKRVAVDGVSAADAERLLLGR
jgi:uncharacterized protein